MMGEASESSFLMRGGLASRGSWAMMLATASRTSWAATSMLRLRLKVTVTTERDSVEVERMLSMPSTVATESSTKRVTALSISSGEAPGRMVRTETMGRSTSGKRSTPSLV
jgi:hypothetical protein